MIWQKPLVNISVYVYYISIYVKQGDPRIQLLSTSLNNYYITNQISIDFHVILQYNPGKIAN